MADQDIAEALHQQAIDLHDKGEDELALQTYHRALELDWARADTHYNIGLIHKYRGEWAESQKHNQYAVQFDPDDEASNWNLAIAATALRDWRTARDVWQRLGMKIEAGDTPIEADFGTTPVRLNPDENAEVVWARRIDPVRARLLNIPYAESGACFGDVVLHDGAAVGYRERNGREYPVFNVLELFQPSTNSTYEARLRIGDDRDVEDLMELLDARQIAAEDWSHSVRILCKQCSEGTPHEHHDQSQTTPQEPSGERLIAISGADEAAIRQALADWSNSSRTLLELDCTLAADQFEDG